MRWQEIAVPEVKKWESYQPKAYRAPEQVGTDKWTIGYGTTRYPNGGLVQRGDVIHEEMFAASFLEFDIEKSVKQALPLFLRTPTTHQLAAFAVLVYNIGVGRHDGVKGDFADSDLLKAFNTHNEPAVHSEWVKWDKAKVRGRYVSLPGLTNRRKAELVIYDTAD